MRLNLKALKSKTFLLWFLSYLAILIIPVISMMIMYTKMATTAKQDILQTKNNSLNQFQRLIDDRMTDLEATAINVYNTPFVKRHAFLNDFKDSADIFYMYQVQTELQRFRIANSLIKNIYIYNSSTNSILSIENLFYVKDLSEQNSTSEIMNVLSVIETYKDQRTYGFSMNSRNNRYSRSDSFLTYCYPLSFSGSVGISESAVIISIDITQLRKNLTSSLSNITGSFYMVDDKNNVLSLDNTMTNEQIDFNYNEISSNSMLRFDRMNKDIDYICMSAKSNYFKWYYSYVFDGSIIHTHTKQHRFIFALTVTISCLVGIFVSFLFTKKNYNPIDTLKSMFGENQSSAKSGDVQYIIEQINGLKVEKAKVEKQLETQSKIIRSTVLVKALKDGIPFSELESTFNSYGIILDDTNYIVAVVGIQNADDLLQRQMWDTIYKATSKCDIENIYQYITETEPGIYAIIVAVSDTIVNSSEIIEHIIAETYQNIFEHLKMPFGMTFSGYHNRLHELGTAYKEAYIMLEYSWICGSTGILSYDKEKANTNSSFMQNMFSFDYNYINSLKVLDFNSAKAYLNEIFDAADCVEDLTIQMYRYRLFGLINMLIGAIDEFMKQVGENHLDLFDIVEKLYKAKSISDLKLISNELFEKLEHQYNNFSSKKLNCIIIDAKKFIDKNYMDMNLSVAMVADHLSINSSYLSQLFKKETGHSTVDYIHITRLTKAKELLDEYKIKDVAIKVGYQDVRSLIRVFKKYEGITPGKFKELDRYISV